MTPIPLYERMRPITWTRVIAQPKILATLDRLRAARGGLGGGAYWLTGPSGAGKSTIARLIAAEVASDFCTVELVGRDLSAGELVDAERMQPIYGFGGDKCGRAWIVNEAHGMSRLAVERLLNILEPIPGHVVWCFTTTNDGMDRLFDDQIDAHPLLSRCTVLALARRDLAKPMAEALLAGAEAAGLNGQPAEKYVRLIQECKNNMREAWNRIEAGCMLAD